MSKSTIFRNAWLLVKQSNLTLSNALRLAWRRAKLAFALSTQSTYSFSFEKTDGTIRSAKGTSLSNSPYVSNGASPRKFNPLVVLFWDLENAAVRSCRIDRLVA